MAALQYGGLLLSQGNGVEERVRERRSERPKTRIPGHATVNV